jgi:signal transduction histidine kinase
VAVSSTTSVSSHATGQDDGAQERSVLGFARRVVARLSAGDGTFDVPPLSDVLLASLVGAIGVLSEVGPLETRIEASIWPSAPVWVLWLLLLVATAALIWRRVTPGLVMPITGFAVGGLSLLGFANTGALLAVLIALYSVTAYGTKEDGRWAIGVSGVFVVSTLGLAVTQGDGADPVQALVTAFAFVGVWALGERTRGRRELVAQLRARAEELEQRRALATDLAVADERRRIARELHDVVAHAVSVVVVQAAAGQHVAANDPRAAASALAAIESTGRDAMAELRRLVDVLRAESAATEGASRGGGEGGSDQGPQPHLSDLPAIVGRVREAGLPVEFLDVGRSAPLPRALELAAVRIVQESLTNVLKHAGPVGRVEVVLERRPTELTVTIEDDGGGPRSGVEQPGDDLDGHGGAGIVGMRERVALFGGSLLAGPRPRGGFRVRARLPIPATRGGT